MCLVLLHDFVQPFPLLPRLPLVSQVCFHNQWERAVATHSRPPALRTCSCYGLEAFCSVNLQLLQTKDLMQAPGTD